MSGKNDDLEAVRVVAETLEPFNADDRERIIRWARERVGMTAAATVPALVAPAMPSGLSAPPASPAAPAGGATDISSFVTQKNPKSDVHFAATVAYYHQFVANPTARKDSITKEDLVEACRLVPRKQPKVPAQVLVNAYQDGVLDRGGKGHYKLNSVGENLVAMALPGKGDNGATKRSSGRVKKKAAKRGRPVAKGKAKGARKRRG